MNPSSSGWIEKFGSLVQGQQPPYSSFEALYTDLKAKGFVYGINNAVPTFIVQEHPFSEDEKAKINLLSALYFTYKLRFGEHGFYKFLEKVFLFYQALELDRVSFMGKLFLGKKTSSKLEKLIASRIYLEDTLLGKTFNSFITNSLLFVDVLLFKSYLNGTPDIKKHAQQLEFLTINVAHSALSSREKSARDDRLAELLQASLTYIDRDAHTFNGAFREKLLQNKSVSENQYILDIACLTVWEDKSLEYQESEFIFALGRDMGFERVHIGNALKEVTAFFIDNAENVPFLQHNNLAVQFYDGMGKLVNKLILRNSKRLQKELSESAELVALLSKSTVRDLTPTEKRKVQDQLLDIFKSIPSLAIFLLPGGAILLPLFIKLVPKLLPSSFDENRVEKPEKGPEHPS
ncbi:LETM1-related biofilm-associated protein [Maribacter sp. 2307ULW6-5]|uniref:LETM1-related biofilm-associated protein n=1 Tax=Maribacter sp. 2307ULW6-5 TaxID=3386275 RepID=UPI0039BCCDBE